MIAWFATVLVACNGIARLYPPVTTPAIEAQAAQGEAAPHNEDSAGYQRGSDKAPIVVKLLPPEEDHDKAAEEKKRQSQQSLFGLINAYSNVFIAIFTTVVAAFTIGLWFVARGTAKKQLRAYVGLKQIELDTPNLVNPKYRLVPDAQGRIVFYDFVRLHLYNYGQTPASNITTVIGIATIQPLFSPLPADFAYPTQLPPPGPQVAAFRDRLFLEPRETAISYVALTDSMMEQLRTSEAKAAYLYFYGEIEYDDIYGRRWRHMFCRAYEPWRAEGNRFLSYKEHNGEEEVRK